MINVMKVYNLTVDFSKGLFSSEDKIIFVENDNKSSKFVFKFESEKDLSGKYATLKIKHYLGFVKEISLLINNNEAEFVVTNDILVAGKAKMSISLIGDNNEILTAVKFLDNVEIKESLGNGKINSEEELEVLEKILSEMENCVKKEEGKGLSTNDFTDEYKRKIDEGGGGTGGTNNYNDLNNLPSINGKELTGNKTLEELGINNFSGNYEDLKNLPQIPSIDGYATEDWVNMQEFLKEHQSLVEYAKKTEIPDVSRYITKTVNDLINYYSKTEIDTKIGNIETLLAEV